MLEIGYVTDKGKVRALNEDSIYVSDGNNDVLLYIVADGMGGYNAGEVASKMAIDEIKKYICEHFKKCEKNRNHICSLIREAVQIANKKIFDNAKNNENLSGMGTTVNMLLFYDGKVYVANVGDSRSYVIRRDRIYQITRDHSYVEQLVRSGQITKEEAKTHPQKNIITKALGAEGYIDVDIYVRTDFQGDVFIICSDGLTNMVANNQIKRVVQTGESCQESAERLVKIANENGGVDNISVIVLKKK